MRISSVLLFRLLDGTRSYPHWEVGYMPRKGPALRLELPSDEDTKGNQIYVFVCSDANKVKDLLMKPVAPEKE